jgi:hypothetical protein
MPFVEILDIGNAIESSDTDLQHVGILCEESFQNDPSSMLFSFKVSMGKARKEFVQRHLAKIMRQEFHRIGAHDGKILVLSGMVLAECHNPQSNVFGDFGKNFQPLSSGSRVAKAKVNPPKPQPMSKMVEVLPLGK